MTRFQKGNKIGKGRPRVSDEDKRLTRLTRTKFKISVRKYLGLNKQELKKIATDPSTPALDLMIVSVMNKAIVSGDERKMEWFLDQLFGKIKANGKIEVSTGNEQGKTTVVLELPDNGRIKE